MTDTQFFSQLAGRLSSSSLLLRSCERAWQTHDEVEQRDRCITYEKDVDNQKGKGKKQSEKPEKTVVKWKPMHMDIAEKRALSCSEIMNSGR